MVTWPGWWRWPWRRWELDGLRVHFEGGLREISGFVECGVWWKVSTPGRTQVFEDKQVECVGQVACCLWFHFQPLLPHKRSAKVLRRTVLMVSRTVKAVSSPSVHCKVIGNEPVFIHKCVQRQCGIINAQIVKLTNMKNLKCCSLWGSWFMMVWFILILMPPKVLTLLAAGTWFQSTVLKIKCP